MICVSHMMYEPFVCVCFSFSLGFVVLRIKLWPRVLGEHSSTGPGYSSFCERLTSFCIMNYRLIHVVAGV